MKYIIKNCNCFILSACCTPNADRLYCKDINDCLLKRIVNECKMNMSDDDLKYILEHKNDEGIIWLTDSSQAILNILKLLEIEEVE